jgi:hypothetical protein
VENLSASFAAVVVRVSDGDSPVSAAVLFRVFDD